MLKKEDRTIARYKTAGAMMRLYKAMGANLLVEVGPVISAADQDKILKAMSKIDAVCSDAEDNMFRDHPELPDDYLSVFYGDINGSPANEVDREIIMMARDAASALVGNIH